LTQFVMPAKAGLRPARTEFRAVRLDSRLRENDGITVKANAGW